MTTGSHRCRYVGVEALKDIGRILCGTHCGTVVYRELLFPHDCPVQRGLVAFQTRRFSCSIESCH